MRGSRTPSVKAQPTEAQQGLRNLSRNRRTKIAKAAQTTLVKVDQWARGDAVAIEIVEAIERAISTAKKKK